jgi:hypothetical protein
MFNPNPNRVPPILETISKVPSKEELREEKREKRKAEDKRRKERNAKRLEADLARMKQEWKASKEARELFAKKAKEKSAALLKKTTDGFKRSFMGVAHWADRTVDGTLHVAGNVVKWPFLVAVAATLWPAGKAVSFLGDVMWNGSFKRFRQIWRGDEALKSANDNKAGENKKAA